MTLFDNTISTLIAIIYNMFVHYTISGTTKELPYQDKVTKSTIAILVAGVLSIIFAKKIEDNDRDITKQVLSRGMWYGGLLLIVTPIVAGMSGTTFELQIITLMLALGGIIWLSNRGVKAKTKTSYKEDE